VSINATLPSLIKQKLASDKDFLGSLNNGQSQNYSERPKKRYWSFPEFKELPTQVLRNQHSKYTEQTKTEKQIEIGRSCSPRRSKANKIREETMFDYLNFPDPQLYLVGFVCIDNPAEDWTTEATTFGSTAKDFTARTKVVTPTKTPLEHYDQRVS
jgi:hypothetical protein